MNSTETARWHILLVDDEPLFGKTMATLLKQNRFNVTLCENGEAGLAQLASHAFHLVIADLNMPGNMNLEFLMEVRARYPNTPLIVLTGRPSLPSAIESVRLGIHDYLLKPIELQDLLHSIERALPLQNSSPIEHVAFESILGKSEAIRALKELAFRVACSNANVLITGESGTGKEILARAIHASSPRATAPLVTIDCSAIPENFLESMLFGHVKGAFTGATHDRTGLLVTADKGTVFLDEIGELPLPLQAKLLRVIQFGTFLPVGGNEEKKVNVRVVAATNRLLSEETLRGRFRQDLYYRLAVLELTVPPLRLRAGDVSIIAASILQRIATRDDLALKKLSDAALAALQAYHWPGNVRELNNVMERCACLTSSTTIDVGDLPQEIIRPNFSTSLSMPTAEPQPEVPPVTREKRMEAVDREYLDDLLRRHKGNVSRAAHEARLTRQGLHKALIRLGLNAQDYRQP
jgi:two-component system response regulator AtoC